MTGEWMKRAAAAAAIVAMGATAAWAQPPAQQPTGSITGSVADKEGAALTGASVTVRNAATGVERQVFTNLQGVFTIAPLEPGQYTVTATRLGFVTGILPDVAVAAGAATPVKLVLEVKPIPPPDMGVPSTHSADVLNQLPMSVRNAIDAVPFLPGVNSFGVNRASAINGLTGAFLTVTFDAVTNNDIFDKTSGGLLAMTTARLDATDTVAASLMLPSVDVSGAADIAMRTRSGSDQQMGSVYQAFRLDALSGNDWFSDNAGQPKADSGLNQIGVRQGGAMPLPGTDQKAYFFFNYETLRRSGTVARSRTVLNPLTQSGIFRYLVTSGGAVQVREVNVLGLPGAGAALDPTVARVLNDIRAGTALAQQGGEDVNGRLSQTADPNLLRYDWQSPVNDVERQPVVRGDVNLASKHRLGVTYTWESVSRDADVVSGHDLQFPGLANSGTYESRRPLFGATLRSTISDSIFNEFTLGGRWDSVDFGGESTAGAATFTGSDGYALALGLGLSDAHGTNGLTSRSANAWTLRNSVTWQKRRHNFTFGGSVHFTSASLTERQVVPTIGFGVDASDPALAAFNATNLPGTSSEQRAAASSLYALLTGRVSGMGSYATLNQSTGAYDLLGQRYLSGVQNELALYAQDVFRVSSRATLTAGVRWTLLKPFTSSSSTMAAPTYEDTCGISGLGGDVCRFYQVGSTEGAVPTFAPFGPDSQRYELDMNNFAPLASFAWRPSAESGFWRDVFGDPEVATIRLGYAQNFAREGMGLYFDQFGLNAGSQLNVGRSAAFGNLIPAGESAPVLLQQRSRLGPTAYPPAGMFPVDARPGRVDDIGSFVPNISVGRSTTMTVGLLRPISPDMTVEARWINTRGNSLWGVENYNELDVFQNGFFNEFRLAMVNLEKNLAAGRGASFAYFGPGTGTSPLPTYLGYLNGAAVETAGNAALYTGPDWTNEALLQRLSRHNADPYGAAADLDGNGVRRANALAAGFPVNFFVLNPDVGRALMYDSKRSSWHDAIQIEVHRRLSQGLQLNANYQYAWAMASKFVSQRFGYVTDPVPIVRRALKAQAIWNAPWGIAVSGIARFQQPTVDFGNVRLVGMTSAQLGEEYGFREMDDPLNPGRQIVTMLPADIILNTQRAFSVDPTSPTGYSALGVPEGRYIAPANSLTCIQLAPGDCAPRTLIVQAPWFGRIDVNVGKAFQLRGRVTAEVRLDLFNLLNAANYTPVADPGSSATSFQVTSAYSDLHTYDSGARTAQLVWRIKW